MGRRSSSEVHDCKIRPGPLVGVKGLRNGDRGLARYASHGVVWPQVAAAILSQAISLSQSRRQPNEMAKLWLKLADAMTILAARLSASTASK